MLSSEIDPALVDESQRGGLVLKAGDVSVHHPNIIHGSNANTSPERRCGLTIRYIPTSTRIITPEPLGLRLPAARRSGAGRENVYHPCRSLRGGRHMPFRGSEAWK